jgi:hypothetical protein
MRPTQCAVGFLEVGLKMLELRERAQKSGSLEKYLKGHPIPAVRGPDGRMYLTDHHHMGLAMVKLANEWDASEQPAAKNPYRSCSFQIFNDLSVEEEMSMQQFFAWMESHQLSHPFGGQGQRLSAIPKYLTELVDDPYRSLAGLARKAGAFEKVDIPFAEFKWADYLRDKVDSKLICKEQVAHAIQQAVALAREPGASDLPGFRAAKTVAELPSLVEIQERLDKRFGADNTAPDLPPVEH